MMFSQSECMNVKFWTSSKNVSLGARVFEFIFSKDLDCYCIYSVVFFVGKINNNFLKTVIWTSVKWNWLMEWFIANVSNMSSTELKELRMGAFWTLKEIIFMRLNFGNIEDSIEGGLHDKFGLRCNVGIIF